MKKISLVLSLAAIFSTELLGSSFTGTDTNRKPVIRYNPPSELVEYGQCQRQKNSSSLKSSCDEQRKLALVAVKYRYTDKDELKEAFKRPLSDYLNDVIPEAEFDTRKRKVLEFLNQSLNSDTEISSKEKSQFGYLCSQAYLIASSPEKRSMLKAYYAEIRGELEKIVYDATAYNHRHAF